MSETQVPPQPPGPAHAARPYLGFIIFFGVILPAVALVIEVAFALLGDLLFDPIPTGWHVGLVAFVVLANLLSVLHTGESSPRRRGLLARLNGVGTGVALVYAVVFLPLMPLGCFLIALAGAGFLLLAPGLAFLSALLARHELRDPSAGAAPLPRLWPWAGLGVLAAFAPEVPSAWRQLNVVKAASADEGRRAAALAALRRIDPDGLAVRQMLQQHKRAMSLTRWALPRLERDEAAQVYFRVTGDRLGERRGRWADADLGGTVVGRRVEGLVLARSRIEGEVHDAAGLVYLEWTMRFRNAGAREAEARTTIDLPPGGVVSRVTLWVNGQPREATYSGTAHVRAAYESVVRVQRRDPVLVTMSGPEQVLMQCFPVGPYGGEMQVRLGVTAPLAAGAGGRWATAPPRFAERNFDAPAEHEVRIEGRGLASAAPGVSATPVGRDGLALAGRVNDANLAGMTVDAPPPRATVWAADPLDAGHAVRQTLRRDERPAVRRLVVVVDGSVAMRGSAAAVAEALKEVPAGAELRLLVAGDRVLDTLAGFEPAGGRDNVPALLRACALAEEGGPAAIVWVRGPQRVVLDPLAPLHDRLRQLPAGITLHDAPVAAGANVVLAGQFLAPVVPLKRAGELRDDLAALFRRLAAPAPVTRLVRQRVALAEARQAGPEGSPHLVRLWANEEAARLARGDEPAGASELAIKHRLVTPLTGAVVLETKAQYKQAGLELPDDLKEPDYGSVTRSGHGAEPAWWVFGGVVLLVVGIEWRRRARAEAGACAARPV